MAVPGQREGGREGAEREDRGGGLLAPSARTSVEGLTREGCSARYKTERERERNSFLYLENVPSVTGYCTAIPPLSVCLALCLFWKQGAWRRQGDRETERGVALFSEALWHRQLENMSFCSGSEETPWLELSRISAVFTLQTVSRCMAPFGGMGVMCSVL